MDLSWVVIKYIPEKLYGFAAETQTGQQVFFHLGVFRPGVMTLSAENPPCRSGVCVWPEVSPPPILGEPVRVSILPNQKSTGRAPKANLVERLRSPMPIAGIVETFDSSRGFGFIQGSDETMYHLHKSEVLEGRIPLSSQMVIFFPGIRQDRPRACHVKVCPHVR